MSPLPYTRAALKDLPFLSYSGASRALLVAALCYASAHAATPDWPRFRGPNGAGVGTGSLPDSIGSASIRWKIELPGGGHSSPVVANRRIFLTCNPPNTASRVLVALDAENGKIIWQREYQTGPFRQHSDNSYASSSAAVDESRVYVCWMAPEGSGLAALEQKDGKELWRKDLGPFVSQHGPGASPIVEGGKVVLEIDQDQPKSFLAAFDATTGAEQWRWEHECGKASASTPCIFHPKKGAPQVITVSNALGMSAVDLQTGKLAWQLPKLMPKRCVASPVVTRDNLIIGQCGEGQAESFVCAVKVADDGKSAQPAYEVQRTGGYVPTPLALGDLLFLWKENGIVTCLRAATNEQIWSERVQGPFYGSPVAVGDRLYNMTRKGELVVLNAGAQFKELARFPLGEGSHATPAVSGDRLILRTFTHLLSLGK